MGETEPGSSWVNRLRALKSAVADPEVGRPIMALGWFAAAEFGTYVATGLYAFGVGGTPYVSVMFVIQLIASAVLVPILTRAAASVPRASALLASYVAQAVTWLAVGIVMILVAPFWAVVVATAIAATMTGTGRPMHDSLVPERVDGVALLTAANVAASLLQNVGAFLGPGLLALLLAVGVSPGLSIVAFSVGLGVSALLVLGTPRRPRRAHVESEQTGDSGHKLRAVPGVAPALTAVFARDFAYGALDVLVVALVIDELGLGEAAVGMFNAALGVGAVVGSLGAAALVGRPRMAGPVLVGLALGAAALAGLGAAPRFTVTIAAVGLGFAFAGVATKTLVQRLVPLRHLGVAFGAAEAASLWGFGAGAALAPLLTSTIGTAPGFGVLAVAVAGLSLLIARPLGRAEGKTDVPLGIVSFLREVDSIGTLDPPVLEAIARSVESKAYRAGEVIARAGEHAHGMWVVRVGEVEVVSGSQVVATLDRRAIFGEIGLLTDAPRIASVRAVVDTETIYIERTLFLEAIGTDPAVRAGLEELAHRRRLDTESRE